MRAGPRAEGTRPVSTDWGDVYRQTYPELVRYVYRKLWDEERAHELAQEAFLRALDADPPPDRPRGWLFTVAGNLARDEIRTVVRRRRHLSLVRAESDGTDPAADPLRKLERQEEAARARAALEVLGDGDREALLLWDAGLSYEEIATRTGLARGSIGTTLARARRRLAEAYRKLEESDVARG